MLSADTTNHQKPTNESRRKSIAELEQDSEGQLLKHYAPMSLSSISHS